VANTSGWIRFWKGTGWGLFFFKFFVFSILAFLIWSVISIPYGRFLCETSVRYQRRSIPIMDVQYEDYRGITMEITMAPAVHVIVPLSKAVPVKTKIFPNTLHFNIIPFLALIFASPVRSGKHLIIFLVVSMILLSFSHFLHMNLNISSYYYGQQTWEINSSIPAHEQFLLRIRFISKLQAFMEQAGSMIIPFFLWMIYAQQWLFRKLRSSQLQPPVTEQSTTQHSNPEPSE
jgi:hypothetical protein